MPINHAGLQATVTALLNREGAIATFTDKLNANRNKATGERYSNQAPDTFTAKAFRDNYSLREVDEKSVLTGDFKLITQATTTPIEAGMLVAFAGETMQVVTVEPINPKGVVIAYIVQVRK